MKILYPLNVAVFDALSDDGKTEAYISGEEMPYTILYLENLYKSRFCDLNECVEDDYVLNKY